MKRKNQAAISRQMQMALRQHQNAADMMDMAVTELLGINRTDGMCIDIIDQHGTLSPGELATELGLTTAAITAVVDRLVKAGYLRRTPDPDDRRRVVLELTDACRKITGLVFDNMAGVGLEMLGRMSDEDRKLIMRFLDVSIAINRGMAEELRSHVPIGQVPFEERLRCAAAFHNDHASAMRRMKQRLEERTARKDS